MVRLRVNESEADARVLEEFQFQYGTIESVASVVLSCHWAYFNSSMVRLRELFPFCRCIFLHYFNSSMVRLRVFLIGFLERIFFYFNSSMVRLRETLGFMKRNKICDFNSSMVRLRVDRRLIKNI